MRNPSLAAFLVTVVAIVPAGWHALRADLQTDGKHLRPLQQSFTVGDVRVTLDVDSQNATGAVALYERVGMRVDTCGVAFEKTLE